MATNTAAFQLVRPDVTKRQAALVPESPPNIIWGQGTPDGDREPFTLVNKGSLYLQTDATDDDPHVWQKVDEGNDDNDWVAMGFFNTLLPVNVTGSSVTITKLLHAGRVVTLNRAAGIAVTLPASTGSGDTYKFVVGTTFTGAATIKVVGDDIMKGTATLFADGGDTVVGFATAVDSDTIDLLGTANSTGGIAGAFIELIDIAADTWFVRYVSDAGGTEATPFSATVA